MVTNENPIPQTYDDWRECILIRCGLALSRTYINERITELRDVNHARTSEFAKLYGKHHLETTIGWFERAGDELEAGKR